MVPARDQATAQHLLCRLQWNSRSPSVRAPRPHPAASDQRKTVQRQQAEIVPHAAGLGDGTWKVTTVTGVCLKLDSSSRSGTVEVAKSTTSLARQAARPTAFASRRCSWREDVHSIRIPHGVRGTSRNGSIAIGSRRTSASVMPSRSITVHPEMNIASLWLLLDFTVQSSPYEYLVSMPVEVLTTVSRLECPHLWAVLPSSAARPSILPGTAGLAPRSPPGGA